MNFYELDKSKVFNCELKTRNEMERDIPADSLGWWHDCCPGKTLKLRQATPADIERCWLRDGADKNHINYMVEIFERGALVHKLAIKKISSAGLPNEKVSAVIADIRASMEKGVS